MNRKEVGMNQTYKEVRTFRFPNMTVRVHIPDLTEEERNKRMEDIHKQAEKLLKTTKK